MAGIMAREFETFRRIAQENHGEKVAAALCVIEQQISDFEDLIGSTRSEKAAYEFVIGDMSLHPFWFHAWQRTRRAAEAA